MTPSALDPAPRNTPRSRRDAFPYALILPACFGVLLVDVYPFCSAFVLSFQQRIQGRPTIPFVGVDNYREALSDPQFWSSLKITAQWTAGSVAGQLVLGTALALLVHGLRRGQRLFTSLLLLPWVTPMVIAALTCRWILNADFGVLNSLVPLRWLGLSERHDWLGEPTTALPAVVASHIWKYYGFVMLIVLARLKTIPADVIEAARVDGCGAFARFRYVTMPQLRDVLAVAVLLMLIWTFNTFDMVYLMGQGGQATNVLSIEVWRRLYQSFNYGLAAATAVLMFTVLFGFALAYARRCRL